jgi:uncharacterized membrane protein YfcA
VPLLALVMSPIDAAIVVAPLVTFMDFFAFGSFGWRTWSRADLAWLAPSFIVGIALGYLFFVSVDPRIVGAGIGALTRLFAADFFLRGRFAPAKKAPVSPPLAIAAGAAGGFTTFIAHAGSPPLAMYLLRRGLHKTTFAGTTVVLLAFGNLIKLVPYGALAVAKPSTLIAAAVLAPAVPFGVWTGKYLHDRPDQRRLYFWCYDAVRALFV